MSPEVRRATYITYKISERADLGEGYNAGINPEVSNHAPIDIDIITPSQGEPSVF